MHWFIIGETGRVLAESSSAELADVERLLEPGVTASVATYDLSAIAGVIATPAASAVVGAENSETTSASGGFTSAHPIGGLTEVALLPGTSPVATLTLDITGTTGVYHLSFAGGRYSAVPSLETAAMSAGPVFAIRLAAK